MRLQRLTQRAVLVLLSVSGLALVGGGCISAPQPKPNPIEQARHENAIGTHLARQFESQLHYHSDPVVDRYLDGIAGMLATTSGDPRLTGIQVAVISDSEGRWRSFGLPGRKIYLPIGLLRQLHYDNEIAAVIALEDGNILTTHAIDHLNRYLSVESAAKDAMALPAIDFLGPSGIFSFDSGEMDDSIRQAIKLLYGAGFDVRGLLEVWSKFLDNPARAPFSPKMTEDLLDFTRATISLYAPLRDPIVGTAEFQSIRRRIEAL